MAEIREIKTASEKEAFRGLLKEANLQDASAPYAIGLFEDDKLLACGAADGNIIKNIATASGQNGEGYINIVMTDLIYHIREQNSDSIFLFSKPENERIFHALGFHTLAKTDKAMLMESDRNGISHFLSSVPKAPGCIVMNANPFTLGHLALIRKASGENPAVDVFLVEEDASFFSTQERFEMAQGALEDSLLRNVSLLKGGRYIISKATFPAYFLKAADDGNAVFSRLDSALFASQIAPKLGIKRRYVGTEPFDPATAQYNKALEDILPANGIELAKLPRVSSDNSTGSKHEYSGKHEIGGKHEISGTEVRRMFREGRLNEIKSLVPPFVWRYLSALRMADLAYESLIAEVQATPKPGLVDRNDNGSHKDMDINVFLASAEAIKPFLRRMAVHAINNRINVMRAGLPQTLRAIGIAAEEAMLKATKGVNTHKGAIFTLGTMLYCAAVSINSGTKLTPKAISELCIICMSNIMEELHHIKVQNLKGNHLQAIGVKAGNGHHEEPEDLGDSMRLSHGQEAFIRYGAGGIRREAMGGYPSALAGLEFFDSMRKKMTENDALCWTTVFLISRLEDTNMISRSDQATALKAKEDALMTLTRIDEGLEPIKTLDKAYKEQNLSPGGAADLLSAIWFLDKMRESRI
ncbi:MAG: triphosphoribosyl-dephospho-CoA synthase [Sphaerochaetaceae bacterium]